MSTREIGDGAIAGIITGIIMGVLAILLALIGLASLVSVVDIRSVLGGMIPITGLTLASISAMITLLLFMAIIGLVIGAVFGSVYEYIPTVNAITKGLIFMLAIWVIFGLLIPLVLSAGGALPVALTATGIVTALVAALIWGAVLGLIFAWVVRKTGAPARRPIVRTP
jgi:hypothetical protein